MKRRAGYLSVAVCTAALGCGIGPGPDEHNVQISGTVTSAEDGTALEGIQVELWGGSGGDRRMMARSISGPEGGYALESGRRPCSGYSIQAGWAPGDGYETAVLSSFFPGDSARFSGSLNCTDEPQVIDINLIPAQFLLVAGGLLQPRPALPVKPGATHR